MASKPKLSLAWQMMIGLALGVVVGAFVDSAFAQTPRAAFHSLDPHGGGASGHRHDYCRLRRYCRHL
mgnify:CR=1 FL=1